MSERDTLHDFSIEYVKVLAEVFGWRVRVAPGSQKGPDVIVEHVTRQNGGESVDAVMFIESEVGHDIGSASEYFDKLAKRLKPLVEDYKKRGVKNFSIVVITNAPRRLSRYLREQGRELEERLGFRLVEGLTVFIVPVLIAREVLPAVFVRALGASAGAGC
jgi:hypothetical protein